MDYKNKESDQADQSQCQADQSRRDFLKKSKYAAYATPLMTGLIINSNAAHASPTGGGDNSAGGFGG